jgi:hypothetical protein
MKPKLTVQGRQVKIKWHELKIGGSMFIPCIDQQPVTSYLRSESMRRKMRLFTKLVVERGVLGVRAWRIL